MDGIGAPIITKKQRNLILSSEAAKEEFSDLFLFLKENEILESKHIDANPALSNVASYYDDLLDACRAEWKVAESQPMLDLGENYRKHKVTCDLCGKKPLRYKNHIYNAANKIRFTIGSECAKEFGEEIRGLLIYARQKANEASNRLKLEEKVPGIRKFVENGSLYLNSMDMVVAHNLERSWQKVHGDLKKDYYLFVDGKKDTRRNLVLLWEKKESLLEEIDLFVRENKDKKFAANKEVSKWLYQNHQSEAIKAIRKDNGIVTWKTAHRIFEPNFMRMILSELNKNLKPIGISALSLNIGQRTVSLKFEKNKKILQGFIGYKDLILDHGGSIFEKGKSPVFFEILNDCEINEINSQRDLIDLISIQKPEYHLVGTFKVANELVFLDSKERYYLIQLSELLKKLKNVYFNDTYSIEDIDKFLERSTKKVMNYNEYENFKQAKELSSELDF